MSYPRPYALAHPSGSLARSLAGKVWRFESEAQADWFRNRYELYEYAIVCPFSDTTT